MMNEVILQSWHQTFKFKDCVSCNALLRHKRIIWISWFQRGYATEANLANWLYDGHLASCFKDSTHQCTHVYISICVCIYIYAHTHATCIANKDFWSFQVFMKHFWLQQSKKNHILCQDFVVEVTSSRSKSLCRGAEEA